jgi:hypothetical protein
MFEELMVRGAALGAARRRDVRARLALALREEAPAGVAVEEAEEGVRLSGRALVLRSIVDPALRWIAARPA